MTVKKSNLSKSRKKVFDGSFEGAELPCVIIFAWFRIHLAVACETFSHNAVFSHGIGSHTLSQAQPQGPMTLSSPFCGRLLFTRWAV